MALIVITINDTPTGDADIGVLCEPALDTSDPHKMLTPAQVVALNVLKAASEAHPIQTDRGLIQLIN